MIEVVRGDPRKGRIAVEDRQPTTERLVGAATLEGRAVVVIVRDDPEGEREVAAHPPGVGDHRREGELRSHQHWPHGRPKHRSPVRRFSESHHDGS